MGTWYETCGVSGLPIKEGELAWLIWLGPGSGYDDGRSGFSYPSWQWRPLCLPIQGRYDGTGLVTLPAAPPAHWDLTQRVLRLYGWQEQGRGALAVSWDYDHCFRPIERGGVSLTGYRPGPVGQVLVRADVWTRLLRRSFRSHHRHADRALGRIAARAWYRRMQQAPDPCDFKLQLECELRPDLFHQALYRDSEGGLGLKLYVIELAGRLNQYPPDVILSTLYALYDLIHIHTHLGGLRLAWRPQSGKGSQDTSWARHRSWHRLVSELAGAAARHEREE